MADMLRTDFPTIQEKVQIVKAFLAENEMVGAHIHEITGRYNPEAWSCGICGTSTSHYSSGIERKEGYAPNYRAQKALYRTKSGRVQVCLDCDRLIHKQTGTSDDS